MDKILDFILLLLQQFAGGPGPVENNLMRFGLAALLWLVLLVIAWTRQRNQNLPRERLLILGFALALARELVMFALTAGRMYGWDFLDTEDVLHHPLEHALAMAAIIVVAGAYLRYVLDDERVSRRYLQVGIGITVIAVIVVLLTWPRFAAAYPDVQFHHTWQAWVFHVPLSLMIAAAMIIIARKHGWLRNVVILALMFFFISEFLILVNFSSNHAYSHYICPVGNSLHILAIPLLGYVYLKEQSVEKRKAEEELEAYRNQLEKLVKERTAELTAVNSKLQQEIRERQRTEAEIIQRNAGLAALNAIAATISQSLELETILNTTLEMAISALEMDVGAIFLLDQDTQQLTIQASLGDVPLDNLSETRYAKCSCIGISYDSVSQNKAVLQDVSTSSEHELTDYIVNQSLKTIVSTPLLSKAIPVGALTLGSVKVDHIGETELNMLNAIGQQVGVAVENARLFEELEHYTEELSLLHEVSLTLTSSLEPDKIKDEISRQSAKLMDCQIAYVIHLDQDNQICEIVSSHGMTAEMEKALVANSQECQLFTNMIHVRQTTAINDALDDARVPRYWIENLDVRTILCLPLWVNQEPNEFLFLLDKRGSRYWQPEELKLIEAFVNRAVVALENANLHKQIEWAAALEERQRIAADMHDGLAQILSVLGLRVDLAAELLVENEQQAAISEFDTIRKTIEQASVEMRRSIATLTENPAPLRALQNQLTEMIDQVFTDDTVSARLETTETTPLLLSPNQTAQILPIVQEALLNARSHAQANSVVIKLKRVEGMIILNIDDDGVGFSERESPADEQGHFGLSIMRARANRVGGRLRVESVPGSGTRISLEWKPDGELAASMLESSRQTPLMRIDASQI